MIRVWVATLGLGHGHKVLAAQLRQPVTHPTQHDCFNQAAAAGLLPPAGKLLTEVKRLEYKLLLVDIHLLESKV